jgi:hypothetical protein
MDGGPSAGKLRPDPLESELNRWKVERASPALRAGPKLPLRDAAGLPSTLKMPSFNRHRPVG